MASYKDGNSTKTPLILLLVLHDEMDFLEVS